MVNPEDDIRLNLCPKCPGQPVVLIMPGWPYPMVKVICSKCGHSGPAVYFSSEGDKYYMVSAYDRALLPGLARARREAAALWNEQPSEWLHSERGTTV